MRAIPIDEGTTVDLASDTAEQHPMNTKFLRRAANRMLDLAGKLGSEMPAPVTASEFGEKEQRLLELMVSAATGETVCSPELVEHVRAELYQDPPWFDPLQRAESVHPIYFCISYPRSGVTRFIDQFRASTGGDFFSALPGVRDRLYFDKRWHPRAYPRTRIIKDHRPLRQYLHDDGYLIVRDGRDTMVSLAWMTRTRGRHQFLKREELKDFIAWTAGPNYRAYGSWASHTRRLLDLMQGGTKTLVRYEDTPSDASAIEASIASRGPAWGKVDDDLTGTMFEFWQKARGKSTWQQSFDRAAAKAFHDTGATDMLIELGYEADSQWWKQL